MALRMYHEELLGERRWLQAEKAQAAERGGFATAAAAAAQASKTLSSQVKVGEDEIGFEVCFFFSFWVFDFCILIFQENR